MSKLQDLISPEYGYVLLVAAALVLEGFLLGAKVMGVRKKVFCGPEFMKAAKDLLEEHKKIFPNAPYTAGYPDMGNGRYAELLTYEQWYRFMNAQRGHQNFLESVWGVFGLLLVGGLFAPKVYAGLGAVYAFSRVIYAVGYTSSKGPVGREAGAILGALSAFGMILFTAYLGLSTAKLLPFK